MSVGPTLGLAPSDTEGAKERYRSVPRYTGREAQEERCDEETLGRSPPPTVLNQNERVKPHYNVKYLHGATRTDKVTPTVENNVNPDNSHKSHTEHLPNTGKRTHVGGLILTSQGPSADNRPHRW